MSCGSEAPPPPPRLTMATEKSEALQGPREGSAQTAPPDPATRHTPTVTQTPTNTLALPVESWNRRASESAASDRPRVPPGRMAGARCPRLRPRLARLRYTALSRTSVSCLGQWQHHCRCHPVVWPHPTRALQKQPAVSRSLPEPRGPCAYDRPTTHFLPPGWRPLRALSSRGAPGTRLRPHSPSAPPSHPLPWAHPH